ncbi:MAG: epoxyqueuosine reductase, partial [candidate division WOR-3 bacterium]|nr:epoxyqueuosine reductase [candidate division WOR-3 bacterium]
MSKNLTTELLSFANGQGADLAGVAELAQIAPEHILVSEGIRQRMKCAVVAAIRLSEAVLAEITDHPTKSYYHHYRMVNLALDQLALKIVRFLQD